MGLPDVSRKSRWISANTYPKSQRFGKMSGCGCMGLTRSLGWWMGTRCSRRMWRSMCMDSRCSWYPYHHRCLRCLRCHSLQLRLWRCRLVEQWRGRCSQSVRIRPRTRAHDLPEGSNSGSNSELHVDDCIGFVTQVSESV
jgi:hypothetical protein